MRRVGGDQEEAYGRYCDEVEGTAAWGGQLELGALCRVLRRHITVHAVGQPPVEMGEEFKGRLFLDGIIIMCKALILCIDSLSWRSAAKICLIKQPLQTWLSPHHCTET